MSMVAPRISILNGIQSLGQASLTLTHSIRTRGLRQTFTFAALGVGLPIIAEYSAINQTKLLRHRTQPQFQGVPLIAVLGWYNINYPTLALVEGLLVAKGISSRTRLWLVPVSTALVATNLDMLLDCVGLEQGLWEWNENGAYAADITGANGKRGIPLANFGGWLSLTSIVTFLSLTLQRVIAPNDASLENVSSPQAIRTAAFLLLPYYVAGIGWAIPRRKFRYVSYTLPTLVTLYFGLTHRKS